MGTATECVHSEAIKYHFKSTVLGDQNFPVGQTPPSGGCCNLCYAVATGDLHSVNKLGILETLSLFMH